VLEAGRRLDDALRLREEALREEPEDWVAANEVAWSLALLGRDLERAQALATQAVSASEGDPSALDTLARVQLARDEPELAFVTAGRALSRATPELRGHLLYVRATALAARGDAPGARQALETALATPAAPHQLWRAEARVLAERLAGAR
jgi:hypothetical protein